MKRAIFTLLFIFVTGLFLAGGASAEAVLLGKVSLVEGKVMVKDPAEDEFVQVTMGTKIKTSFLLKVPENGKAEICYTDGAIIRFRAGSKVQFKMNSLRLFTGKVWCRVIKAGKKFEVVTPTFVAGVRGTVFTVETEKKQDGKVNVYEGTVYSKTEVQNVDVEAGTGVEVADEGTISEAKEIPPVDAEFAEANWQARDKVTAYKRYIMLLLKGIEAAELNSGAAEKELMKRKKLPEVENAFFTYQSF